MSLWINGRWVTGGGSAWETRNPVTAEPVWRGA